MHPCMHIGYLPLLLSTSIKILNLQSFTVCMCGSGGSEYNLSPAWVLELKLKIVRFDGQGIYPVDNLTGLLYLCL